VCHSAYFSRAMIRVNFKDVSRTSAKSIIRSRISQLNTEWTVTWHINPHPSYSPDVNLALVGIDYISRTKRVPNIFLDGRFREIILRSKGNSLPLSIKQFTDPCTCLKVITGESQVCILLECGYLLNKYKYWCQRNPSRHITTLTSAIHLFTPFRPPGRPHLVDQQL
jgi:hypothetical protein